MIVLRILWHLITTIPRWIDWKLRPKNYPPGPRGWKATVMAIKAFRFPDVAATYYKDLFAQYGKIVMVPLPLGQSATYIADAAEHGRITRAWRKYPRSWLQEMFAFFIGMIIGVDSEEQRRRRKIINEYLGKDAVEAHFPAIQRALHKRYEAWEPVMLEEGVLVTKELVDMFADLSGAFLANRAELPLGLGQEIVELIAMFQQNPAGWRFWRSKKRIFKQLGLLLDRAKTEELGIISAFAREVTAGRISRKGAQAELLGFFAASVETTANLLAATIYFATRDPMLLARIRTEARRVFNGRTEITRDECARLELSLKTVLNAAKERPPAWRQQRQVAVAGEMVTTGGKHYFLPRWSQVFSIVSEIQRDPDIWGPDADTFNPDKFMDKAFLDALPDGAFLPWAAGIHQCPGKMISTDEAVLGLSIFSLYFDDPYFEGEWEPVYGATLGFPEDARLYRSNT